jgi:hypothetical protein
VLQVSRRILQPKQEKFAIHARAAARGHYRRCATVLTCNNTKRSSGIFRRVALESVEQSAYVTTTAVIGPLAETHPMEPNGIVLRGKQATGNALMQDPYRATDQKGEAAAPHGRDGAQRLESRQRMTSDKLVSD